MAEGGQGNPVPVPGTNLGRNCYSIMALIVDLGGYVLRNVLQKIVEERGQSITFSQYLDKSTVRCELFHLWKYPDCCVCGCRFNDQVLKNKQWKLLYHQTGDVRPCNEIPFGTKNHCCLYKALTEVLRSLDVSLMCLMILKSRAFQNSNSTNLLCYTENIQKIRNEIFHINYSTSIEEEEYELIWDDTMRNLKELARIARNDDVITQVDVMSTEIRKAFKTPETNAILNAHTEKTKEIKRCGNTMNNGNAQQLNLTTNRTDERENMNDLNRDIEQFQQHQEEAIEDLQN